MNHKLSYWEMLLNRQTAPEASDLAVACVSQVHRGRVFLTDETGGARCAVPSGKLRRSWQRAEDEPAVGDFVWATTAPGDRMIHRILARKSLFLRRRPGPTTGAQVVAANFDTVLILTSCNQELNLPRLERYLSASYASGGQPVVVLTKADLPGQSPQLSLSCPVVTLSAVTGRGMEGLNRYLGPGQSLVMVGSSGVGKSTLVNRLLGTTLMDTGVIREDDSRGRHTTTHRQLLMLPDGTLFIDTPGMRELGLWDAQAGVGETFEDLETLAAQCRFSDCTHSQEPGCRLRQAVEEGDLSAMRLKNFRTLGQESRRGAGRTKGRR